MSQPSPVRSAPRATNAARPGSDHPGDHRREMLIALVSQRSGTALRIGLPISVALAAVFYFFPGIDIGVSGIFFDPQLVTATEGTGFWLKESPTLNFLFWFVDVVSRGVLVIAIGLMIYFAVKRHPRLLATTIVTLSLILGPALIVNSVLKDHWDRARPRTVEVFGGTQKFTPAWVVSDQCSRNCSFTSGHAAAGFAFLVGHFVAKTRLWLFLGLFSGLSIGIARVAVGAHFLSDVLFSGVVVYLVTALMASILVTIARASTRRSRA